MTILTRTLLWSYVDEYRGGTVARLGGGGRRTDSFANFADGDGYGGSDGKAKLPIDPA